jgi:hypothetical protein
MTDGARSYDMAIAILREKQIRAGNILPNPHNPEETRWASEGFRPDSDLDTVKREAGTGAA